MGNGNPPGKLKCKKKSPVVKALLSISVSVNFILINATVLGIFIMYKKTRSKFPKERQSKTFREYSGVCCFRYKELEHATNGFKDEIGRGAFGK